MPFFFKTETCQHFQKVFILLFLWLFGGLVAKLCPTLVTPWTVACQAPLFVGILQERILEWVAIPFSRGSSRPRNWTEVSSITGRFITDWATREIRYSYIWVQNKKRTTYHSQFFHHVRIEKFVIVPGRGAFYQWTSELPVVEPICMCWQGQIQGKLQSKNAPALGS